eukprot:5766972-Pyramimonas_sp.AAC.1
MYQTWCCGRIQAHEGAPIMLARGVQIPRMVFRHDSGSSKRNGQVDPWRWNPENNVLTCLKVFKQFFSNEATP